MEILEGLYLYIIIVYWPFQFKAQKVNLLSKWRRSAASAPTSVQKPASWENSEDSPFLRSFKGGRLGAGCRVSSWSSLVTASLWGLRADPGGPTTSIVPEPESLRPWESTVMATDRPGRIEWPVSVQNNRFTTFPSNLVTIFILTKWMTRFEKVTCCSNKTIKFTCYLSYFVENVIIGPQYYERGTFFLHYYGKTFYNLLFS